MPPPNKTPIDVLVVGAGPAGLSVAVAALHRGASRILVVDQASALRPAGHGLDLMPNMVRTLSALSPAVAPLVEKHLVPSEKSGFRSALVTPDGSKLHLLPRTQQEPIANLKWWQLQHLLLKALPCKLLLLDHQLLQLVYTPVDHASVEAHFVFRRARDARPAPEFAPESVDQDQEANSKYALSPEQVHEEYFHQVHHPPLDPKFGDGAVRMACRARMVIGADGINSITRQCIYKQISPKWTQFAKPIFTSLYSVFFTVQRPLLTDQHVAYLRKAYMHGAPVCIMMRAKEDKHTTPIRNLLLDKDVQSGTFLCILTASMKEHEFKKASQQQLLEHAFASAVETGVSEKLVALCRSVGEQPCENTIGIHPFSIVPASVPTPFYPLDHMDKVHYPQHFNQPWFHRRAALVGDSAHAGPNFLAQGGGMAVEAAYELVLRLEKEGLLCGGDDVDEKRLGIAFGKYRSGRLNRACWHQKLLLNRAVEWTDQDEGNALRSLWKYDPLGVAAAIQNDADDSPL